MNKTEKTILEIKLNSNERRLNNQSGMIYRLERKLDDLMEYLEVEAVYYPERVVIQAKKDES